VAAHAELLGRFVGGEADVLVGTQMIAKGLDVPAVALVGVVLADIGLHMPDFRAAERTFQVLTQVSGRAGRGPAPGRVVIQTYVPEHYAIQRAAAQDYGAFYEQEIAYRRAQANPPITRLVRLLVGHTAEGAARREAQRFAGVLRRVVREWDMAGVDVVGPAPTYPPRVRNAWRWHLLVRAADPRVLLDKVSIPPGWLVDVDPLDVT
jgi:primosomal protein N' (replication factor Y)